MKVTAPFDHCTAYAVYLEQGEALRFDVEQCGADVGTRVFDPGGSELLAVDLMIGAFGREAGVAVAERTGTHRLELDHPPRSAAATAGYTLAAERAPATPADRAAMTAMRAYRRGRDLAQHHDAGGREEELRSYREALRQWRRAGSSHGEAWALQALGYALAELEELEPAREELTRALALYRRLDEHYAAARTCLKLVPLHRGLDDFPAAEACARFALAVGTELGDGEVIDEAETALAYTLYEADRAAEAVGLYVELLARARRAGARDRELALLSALGTSYIDAGELEKALASFVEADALLGADASAKARARSNQNLGRALYELGKRERDPGKLARAERLLDGARAGFEESGLPRDVAETRNLLGRVAQERGDHDRAGALFREALATLERDGPRHRVAGVRVNLGQHFLLTDRPEEALRRCRAALEGTGATSRTGLRASARYCVARSLQALGRLGEALAQAEACFEAAEELRREKSHATHRATFAEKRRHYYELPVVLHMALAEVEPDGGHLAGAFTAAERARTRTLLELLRAAGADPRSGLDPEVREELEALETELAHLNGARLLSAADPERLAEIDRRLTARLDELRVREGSLAQAHPAYAEMTRPAEITIADAREELNGDTQLLAYFLAEDASWLWLVDRGSSEVYRLSPAAELGRLAREAHHRLAKSDNQTYREAATASARRLADAILGPVAGRLRGPRLAIVADGALHYVPFAALPLPGASAGTDRPERLVDRFEIVYPPSIAVALALGRQRQLRAAASAGAVVIGDPVFSAHDPRVRGGGSAPDAAANGACAALDRLPRSEDEARAIAALVSGSRLLLGFEAERARVLDGRLAGARIVHFATHACIDPARPELSGIALSAVDARGRQVEAGGLLLAREIFGLDLDADLAVVSACSSGLGREVRGEGLLGITRGFMSAGVSQVMVSLWDVDDRATSELMQRFYREMFEGGRPPVAALAEAQRAAARSALWADPAHWAGFVLQGDWRDVR